MDIDGHPFTIAGVGPPGFFGETLRGNPADLWLPLATVPMIAGDNGMLQSETSAWLRAIGRLKPGATTEGLSVRLTGYLRNWIQHDAGYPANWMPDILRQLPNQHIDIVPAGGGVGVMKDQVQDEPEDPVRRVRRGLAHRVRERREPHARARGHAADADRGAARDGRVESDVGLPGARRSHRPCADGCGRGIGRRSGRLATSPGAGVHQRAIPADQHAAVCERARLRDGSGHPDRCHLWRGTGLVRHADGPDRCAARRRARERRIVDRAQDAARRPGDAVRRPRDRRDAVGAHAQQSGASGFRLRREGPRRRRSRAAVVGVRLAETVGVVSTPGRSADADAGRHGRRPRPLQSADEQLGRRHPRAGPPAAEARHGDRRVLGPRERRLHAELRHEDGPWPRVHAARQRDGGRRRDRQRGVRQTILLERREPDRHALRPRPA